MKPQIARAAIVKDDQGLYDCPDITPNYYIVREARASPNPYYLADLLARAARFNIDVTSQPQGLDWRAYTRSDDMELATTLLYNSISEDSVFSNVQVDHIYDGIRADISQIELFVCSPESMRPKDKDPIDLTVLYHNASNPGEEWSKLLKD